MNNPCTVEMVYQPRSEWPASVIEKFKEAKMARCTHTANWHKRMVRCLYCGAHYSEEEADRISRESKAYFENMSCANPEFNAEQLETIERMKAEETEHETD